MDEFIGNLTHINYLVEEVFMFGVFFTTPPIRKYETESIMGAFRFLGVKLTTHANEKT